MGPDMQNGSAPLEGELEIIAERLRQLTVQVRGHQPGGGAGVIWRSTGTIITNAHVAPAPSATVTLADGRAFEAPVTARDSQRDLAVLALQASDLPAASIGDSSTLRVGELAFAVGNPLGIVGALSVIAPTYRTSDEDLASFGRALARHANALSLALGAAPEVRA